MFNLAQNFIDKVDINKTTATAVAFLGEYIDTESAAASRKAGGKTVTVSDITKRDDYEQSRAAQIDIILSSDNDIASVLADSMKSKGYKVVTDVNKLSKDSAEREKQVYIDLSNGKEGMAQLTDGQKKAARNHVGNLIDSMIDKKYGVTTTPVVEASWQEKQFWWNRSQDKKKNQTSLNQLALLYAGKTEEDIKGAIQYFKGLSDGKIQDIKRTDTGISVIYKNKDGKLVESSPLTYTSDFNTFAKTATALTGIEDADESLKSLDLTGNLDVDFDGNLLKTNFEFDINLPSEDLRPSSSSDPRRQFRAYLQRNIQEGSTVTDVNLALSKASQDKKVISLSQDGVLMIGGKAASDKKYDLKNAKDITSLINVVNSLENAATYIDKVGAQSEGTGSKYNKE
jgi:hypothetical protein